LEGYACRHNNIINYDIKRDDGLIKGTSAGDEGEHYDDSASSGQQTGAQARKEVQ